MKSTDPKTFSIAARIQSFVYAFRGFKVFLQTQHNAWIHLTATILVIVLGVTFDLPKIEWILMILCIIIVWVVEALNTSIEFLANTITLEYHPLIEKAKDVAAASVLIAAIGAILVGFWIFGPYFIHILSA